METPLTFEYDEVGDSLYINTVPPYPEQESGLRELFAEPGRSAHA